MMEKRYKTKETEGRWIQRWESLGIYRFNPRSDNPVYAVDTPPPYVSADHLHLGHAMSYIQAETIVRFWRMLGYNIYYPMGFDDNGLPTERSVEKKHKINKAKISPKAFIGLCLDETRKGAENYRKIWRSLGIGVDWTLEYSTIGELSQRIAQRSFIELLKKKLIYREESPTFWCASCKTALAQADLEDEECKAKMYYIKFEVKNDNDQNVTIATTRPEMLPACVALYVHPEDGRFNSLIGLKASVPIFNQVIPIFASQDVDLAIGTGIMMVCTWGDAEDVKKWKIDKLDTRIIINESGRLTEAAGEFRGLKLGEARIKIIKRLQDHNLLIKEEDIVHTKNIHDRCGTAIEFIASKQWFIKILDFRADFLRLGNEIKWYPHFMKDRYDHWVRGLKWDWCISRDRYYGVPFPVWYCAKCGAVALPESKDLPVDPRERTPEKLCCSCGNDIFVGEQQVMDTWMISSLTPLINAKWQESNSLMDKIYPMSLRIQAFEIIRTWLFYTIVKSYFHSNSLPWKEAMISGWGLDQHGKKMSKSKGNVVLIEDAVAKYSADAVRWWATGAGLGQSLRYSEVDLKSGNKLVNKLWNVGRFIKPIIQDWEKGDGADVINFSDRWILAELQAVVFQCTRALRACDFNQARIVLEKFFWLKYCDNYLELCKDRAWNPEKYPEEEIISLKRTLWLSIEILLKLFAPIIPFVTEEIYHVLFNVGDSESIHTAKWPEVRGAYKSDDLLACGAILIELINKIRHFKTKFAESFRSEIGSLSLITDNLLLQESLSDLAGLARAKASFINQEIEGGERYEVKGGCIILK